MWNRQHSILAALTSSLLLVGVSAPSALAGDECGTFNGNGCAPASKRVDLDTPTFSNPTEITNPLFPISDLHSALLLGHVDGKPFRTETTLLPDTEVIEWRGQSVEVRLSQYMAYLDGRLAEVAIDRYAQADGGSVWYFGENVFDYEHGTVMATEGTWLAGREGPAAMIMPGDPAVGMVYRPENAPGVVFEEVTVKKVGTTAKGPLGSVDGALIVDELHVDNTHERKVFAPGYGEFRTAGGGDLEAIALAVPLDAKSGLPSAELTALTNGSIAVLETARVGDWQNARAALDRMNAAWDAVRGDEAPPSSIEPLVSSALRHLDRAVTAKKAAAVGQPALDLAQSALDLELRHRPVTEVDAGRFELWTQQLRIDAAANDADAVAGDVLVLEWIRDRLTGALDAGGLAEVNARLRDLRVASDAKNLDAAIDHAARLGARMRTLVPRTAVV